jgi:LPS export ABC transporter protein LptC
MKRIRIAILISIGLIVVVVSLILWANYKGRKVVEDVQLPKIAIEGADSAIEKVRFVEEKEGRKTWELEAKSMHHYQDKNFMILEDVKVTFFAEDGRTVILTGKQGKVHQDTKDMELQGDVVATSSDGYRFRTQSVAYHHQEKKIQTPDPVEFDGEQVWLKGRGMLVDVEARTVKVLHEVKTQWKAVRKG